MPIAKAKKGEIIAKFRNSPKDTGHTTVQVALLTERINQIGEHMKGNKKDHSSQSGLLRLVGRRRRMLRYLQRIDLPAYAKLIKQLDLRK